MRVEVGQLDQALWGGGAAAANATRAIVSIEVNKLIDVVSTSQAPKK